MVLTTRTVISAIFRRSRYFSNTSVRIPSNEGPSSHVELNGWVQKAQKCGGHLFLHVSDGLSPKTTQVVIPKDLCRSVHVGSAVRISGVWQPSLGSQQEREVLANTCELFASDADPRYSDLSPDQLRKKIHLRTRSPSFSALLRLRSKLLFVTHDYFMTHGYVHIDTPVFTTNDCEGAGETFTISDSSSKEDFFARENTFLSVSSQLHLEAMVSGISHVYSLSTGCRADKQQSRNHLSEFRMLEAEIAFCNNLNELMVVPEDFLRHCIRNLLNTPDMVEDFESLGAFSSMTHLSVLQAIVDSPAFPRLTYAEALRLLSDKKQKLTGKGLSKINEAFLVKYHNSPVFVTHFPSDQKPFYMLRSSNGEMTESFDLLCPGVCELAGGSIREPSAETLRRKNSSAEWYAEIRERGKPISGGFGLGFERLLQFLLGIQNIKDTIAFPRWFKHCQC
ncbi:hypothetical protein RB195_010843 [Necator americanus]|uniref:Nucleic acid-binding domain protein n=2 Tax=Necator americanus TaxID=51031 RepID=W2TWD8_NECAM|nr:nucleic acid-binding domain protein [Necator americanus]ETN86385.1 nucleic acid-binding domain protein [Necator americanus]